MGLFDEPKVEWVVMRGSGKLAIVRERADGALRVAYPLDPGNPRIVRESDVKAIDLSLYPRMLTGKVREAMKARGEVPRDEVEKVCRTCFTLKPICEFDKNKGRKDGSNSRRPDCRSCRPEVDGQRVREDGTRPAEPAYGQVWKCPCCGRVYIVGVTCRVSLDHDHLTGYARDYICDSCNTGLGKFRNGGYHLEAAIRYLGGGDDIPWGED